MSSFTTISLLAAGTRLDEEASLTVQGKDEGSAVEMQRG